MPQQLTLVPESGQQVLAFPDTKHRLAIHVRGLIGNSITTSQSGKQRTDSWKRLVASEVKSVRGTEPWNASLDFAISLAFCFHRASHGNQPLDVENFLKPVIDALAAGLFCDAQQDIASIARFHYDDSNFRHFSSAAGRWQSAE